MTHSQDKPLLADLAALKTLTMPELRARWQALFDALAPANRRGILEQRLAWRLQELALGGPTPKTARSLDRLAEGGDASLPDPRLPAIGTRLIRAWEGTEHSVIVERDGFVWQGQRFRSLSAVARAITGMQWNGYRFFGLGGKD